MAEIPPMAQAMYHQAYACDPCRREALGLLTVSALDSGEPHKSLAYSRQMLTTPKAAIPSWNGRPAAYEWLGIDIHTQVQRANGLGEEAEGFRLRVLAKASQKSPIISLVHATRGRPKQASIARKVWLDLAENPDAIEHVFVFDEDDKDSYILTRMHHLMVPKGGGCVNAWNIGAFNSVGQIIVQMSDDFMPPVQWDKLIRQKFFEDYERNNPGKPAITRMVSPDTGIEMCAALDQRRVLHVSDGHRADDLMCMAICTRNYFLQDDFLFHPWFTGVYSDNWFSKVAYDRREVIEARDLVFSHDHPFFRDKGVASPEPLDATYQAQNDPKRYEEGLAIYNQLLDRNDWSTVPGYFNFWSFYQNVAKTVKDGETIAELGVWFGRSVIFLAQELKRLGKTRVKILAVDNFEREANQREHNKTLGELKKKGTSLKTEFLKNVHRCGVADMITLMPGDSVEIASRIPNETLAFCYIDAAHDYESVKRDIAAWLPKMKKNHLISGHDA